MAAPKVPKPSHRTNGHHPGGLPAGAKARPPAAPPRGAHASRNGHGPNGHPARPAAPKLPRGQRTNQPTPTHDKRGRRLPTYPATGSRTNPRKVIGPARLKHAILSREKKKLGRRLDRLKAMAAADGHMGAAIARKVKHTREEASKAVARVERRYLAWELMKGNCGYDRIAAELTRRGFPCSITTAYYDVQEVASELDAATKRIAERHREKLLARAEDVALYMTPKMQRGSEAAGRTVLASLELQARLTGQLPKDKDTGPAQGNRPFADLSDDELALRAREVGVELVARAKPVAGAVVPAVAVKPDPEAGT